MKCSEGPTIQIQHVSVTAPSGADLHDASPLHDHRDHGCSAVRAVGGSLEFRMAVGAEEIEDLVHGDLVLRFDGVAPVDGREPQPAVLTPEGHADPD